MCQYQRFGLRDLLFNTSSEQTLLVYMLSSDLLSIKGVLILTIHLYKVNIGKEIGIDYILEAGSSFNNYVL